MWGDLWLVIPGVVLLLIAALLQAYCEVGRQLAPGFRPKVFDTSVGILLQLGWIVLLLIGGMLLLLVHWIAAVAAICLFWLVLPLWLIPVMKRRMLPPWEVVKDDLEGQGYTEDNYLSGDWWKKKKKEKRVKKEQKDKA